MNEPKCASCLRFEELLLKWDIEPLTDEEAEFTLQHGDNCPTGLHTTEAIEIECGLPPGSLRNWNGIDLLPKPNPEAFQARVRALRIMAGIEDTE